MRQIDQMTSGEIGTLQLKGMLRMNKTPNTNQKASAPETRYDAFAPNEEARKAEARRVAGGSYHDDGSGLPKSTDDCGYCIECGEPLTLEDATSIHDRCRAAASSQCGTETRTTRAVLQAAIASAEGRAS